MNISKIFFSLFWLFNFGAIASASVNCKDAGVASIAVIDYLEEVLYFKKSTDSAAPVPLNLDDICTNSKKLLSSPTQQLLKKIAQGMPRLHQ